MSKFFSLILSLLAALVFVACGDSSSSATSDDSNSVIPGSDRESKNADITADTFDDVINCTSKREGKTAYIKKEKTLYTCEDGEWVETSFDDSNEPAPGSDRESGNLLNVKSSSSSAKSSSDLAEGQVDPATVVKGEMTDDRDCQTYKTVTIGTQTWMAENLNYDPGDVRAMGSYAWHGCYDNQSTNCSKYGRLYTWEVAMDNAACAYGKVYSPSGTV